MHNTPKPSKTTETKMKINYTSLLVLFSATLLLATAAFCWAEEEVVPEFVRRECMKTRYPAKCIDSFGHYQDQGKPLKPGQLLTPAIQISADELSRTKSRAMSLPNIHSTTTAEHTAWQDCVELMDQSLSHLAVCAPAAPSRSDTISVYLSAVLTNLATCGQGFSDLKCPDSAFERELIEAAANVSELVSNALVFFVDGQSRRRRRRLLSENLANGDEFPRWVSRGDRRLLQKSSEVEAKKMSDDVVVAKDGSGNYSTINDALAAAPVNSSRRYVIHIKRGIYDEIVEVPISLSNIMLRGDGADSTIVRGNRSVDDGSTTFKSATVAVSGSGFIARDMTFQNGAGPAKHQAVALRLGGDKSVIFKCSIEGYQDTLYVYSMRQFYKNCSIYGTVDFIFGNAAAVIQSCNILARQPLSGQFNAITAQGRDDPNEDTGISVHRCSVDAAEALGATKTYLGRPWRAYSRTVFMLSSLGSLIDPAGWHEWDGDFALDTLFYGEYQNSGEGAGTAGRVEWKGFHVITSASTAVQFTVSAFIDGDSWLPSTNVPYSAGL